MCREVSGMMLGPAQRRKRCGMGGPQYRQSSSWPGLALPWLLVLAILGSGCQSLEPINPTASLNLPLISAIVPIEALSQSERVGQTVRLSGRVVQRLPLLDGWLYQLDDGTGQLWVRSSQPAPALELRVHVKGTLRSQTIAVEGLSYEDLYLEEQRRHVVEDETAS